MSDVDVFDLLERLGADPHPASGGQEASYSCFFHTDERPSAYMNVETAKWFCWSCKERGRSPVSLVARVQGVSIPQAESWLQGIYGVTYSEPTDSMEAEIERRMMPLVPRARPQLPSEIWLKMFGFNWASDPLGDPQHYLLDRGFSGSVLDGWEVGFDDLSERLTIPLRDVDGELVGFKGRGWRDDQQPKYLILGDRSVPRYGFDPYEASEHLFGLHRAREHDTVVLCEGELDAIALAQVDIRRPCAVGGSYFSEHHAELLRQECKRVLLFFDSDDAGAAGVQAVVSKLEPYLPVYVVPSHEGDPADMTSEAIEHCIYHAESSMLANLNLS